MKTKILLLCLFGIVFNRVGYSDPKFPWERFKTIETYGDSITAGFFANLDLTDNLKVSDVKDTMKEVVRTLGLPRRVHKFDRPNLAWPNQLKKLVDSRDLVVDNYARSGATVYGIQSQVEEVKLSKDKKVEKTLAFFLIGHNDVCKRPLKGPNGFEDFYASHFKKAIEAWSERHRDSVAILLPIADPGEVMTKLWDFEWAKGETCRETYLDYAHVMCPLIAKKIEDKDRKYSAERAALINDYLKDLPSNKKLKIENDNRLFYLDASATGAIEGKFFSIDCFHLNAKGQSEVGKTIFKALDNLKL